MTALMQLMEEAINLIMTLTNDHCNKIRIEANPVSEIWLSPTTSFIVIITLSLLIAP